jgi:fibronectin type 3 domain-containing protein
MPGATSYYIYTSANQGGPYTYYTYVVTYPSINLQISPNQTPGLPGGYVIIASHDLSGASAYSQELPVYPDSKYPGVGSLSTVSGTNVVNLNWSSLAKATGYNIYRTTGNSPWQKIGSTTQFVTGFVDTTVTNDVLYYYAFSGSLDGTDSVWSNVVTGSPHARTIPAPQNLVARPGDASVTLSWDPVPGANQYTLYSATVAGGPYSYYTYFYSNAITATGLGNGTPAHFVVVASTPEGVSSDYSAEITATPQANNPPTTISLPPPSFTNQLEQNEGIYLSWSAPAGATSYHLYRSLYYTTTQTQLWTLVGTPSGQTFFDPDVTNGVGYQYAVAGVANAIEGPWVFSSVITPKSTDPLGPTGVYTHSGNGTVTLSWDAVAGATQYDIYSSATPGGPYSFNTYTSTPEVNVTLTNGATNYYVVTAYTTAWSGYSQEVSSAATAQLPGYPSMFSPTKASGQVSISWSSVSGASSYLVYRFNPGAAHWTLIGQTSALNFLDTTVTNGTPYQYSVAALNGSGTGAWAYPTSLITPG